MQDFGQQPEVRNVRGFVLNTSSDFSRFHCSSYILVMIAMDRFQAICYPMNNRFWHPSRSKLKIVFAWVIAVLFCLPQALIFGENMPPEAVEAAEAGIQMTPAEDFEADKNSRFVVVDDQITCTANLEGTWMSEL